MASRSTHNEQDRLLHLLLQYPEVANDVIWNLACNVPLVLDQLGERRALGYLLLMPDDFLDMDIGCGIQIADTIRPENQEILRQYFENLVPPIQPDSVTELAQVQITPVPDTIYESRRDLFWKIEDTRTKSNCIFRFRLGDENQSTRSTLFPPRVYGYNGADYTDQLRKIRGTKEHNRQVTKDREAVQEKLDHETAKGAAADSAKISTYKQALADLNTVEVAPLDYVLTITLNFTTQPWDRRSRQLVGCVEGIPPYLVYQAMHQNLELLVFDLAYLGDRTISRFRSDFRFVLQFLSFLAEYEKTLRNHSLSTKDFWNLLGMDQAQHPELLLRLFDTFVAVHREDYPNSGLTMNGNMEDLSMISFYDRKISELSRIIEGAILVSPTISKDTLRTMLLARDDYKDLSEQEFDACWDDAHRKLARPA